MREFISLNPFTLKTHGGVFRGYLKTIYDGYILQLYAQYFSLLEMEYQVTSLSLYSVKDNKKFSIPLPKDDERMFKKFKDTISQMNNFDMTDDFTPNPNKCKFCIYAALCDKGGCVDDECT